MPKSPKIQTLIALSRELGCDPSLVLAGGGNTSMKEGGVLYVKASGHALSTLGEDGLVRIDRKALERLLETRFPRNPAEREARVLLAILLTRLPGEEHKRPSVETLLHGLLPYRFVVHLHPALVNGLTCSRAGKTRAARLFGTRALWVPYTDPGLTLALLIRGQIQALARPVPKILLMENHGLLVAGDSPSEIRKTLQGLLADIRKQVRETPDLSEAPYDRDRAAMLAPAVRMPFHVRHGSAVTLFSCTRAFQHLLRDRKSFKAAESAFTPDHIVYCQSHPLFVAAAPSHEAQIRLLEKGVRAYCARHGVPPKVVAVQGLGVYCTGKTRAEADTVLALFSDTAAVAHYSRSFGGPHFMSRRDIRFITNWEAESYRKKVSAGHRAPGRLEGRIAVVTGAAQGFGLGLARTLLTEGAHVVLADLNLDLARCEAGILGLEFGASRVLALPVDVTRDDSVKELVRETLLAFGGIDCFVSNAGILKAGSLEELSPKEFDLVTRVNYTGFFLCARHASVPMKLQHRFAPEHFMDLVQINSKSGLSGSKNNFAYAGGKFGGVGLVQSFALELVEHRIKVNALCPGNLFDGPLWSDPHNGLFVQYLRAGKVSGARSVAEVRRFYESKVPMRRGCTVLDVGRALLYAVEQTYETGQAIPVTGGQNMLS